MQLTARLYRGDYTHLENVPFPFKIGDKEVGSVVAVAFDGEYTVGTIEVTDPSAMERLKDVYKPRAMIHGA